MATRTKLLTMGVLIAGVLGLGVGTMWVADAAAQAPTGAGPGGPGAGGPPPRPGDPDAPRGRTGGRGEPGPATGTTGQPATGMFGRGGTGGIMAGGPLPRLWDYKFEATPASSDELHKLVTNLGDEGWEFAGQVTIPRTTQLVFKRAKPGGGVISGGGFGAMGGPGAGFNVVGGGNIDEAAEAAFRRRDRNGDGKLSKEEASPVGGLTEAFERSDANKDGFINLDEYRAFARPRQPGGSSDSGSGIGGISRSSTGTAPGGSPPPRVAMELKLYQLKNADASSMVRILTDLFGNRPELRVIADRRTNTLIVHGSAADMDVIAALIQRLDGPEDASGGKGPAKR
jgi:hypothetical protein